jgi:hypothetical protein
MKPALEVILAIAVLELAVSALAALSLHRKKTDARTSADELAHSS